MNSTNRFRHILAQDIQDVLNDNADILTLPEGAGQEPEIEGDNTGANFPDVEWDFVDAGPDLETFNDDVTALIEHLADLQVPMAVLEKAIELINLNQGSQDEPETDTEDIEEDGSLLPEEPSEEISTTPPKDTLSRDPLA